MFLEKLLQRQSLSREESKQAAAQLLEGNDPAIAGAFLMLLQAKGVTAEELAGFVEAARERALPLNIGMPVLDIVGTGGDRAGTINLSTGSALLASMLGIPVVKHGNRAVSSQAGSADVLEAMGYDLFLSPDALRASVRNTNFGFCFAPHYHPLLKAIAPIRKALKTPTIFNLMGPLLNPAGLGHMMIGVYDPALVDLMADALFALGTKRSLVFCGSGIDELSCLGPIDAIFVTDKGKERLCIDPEALGLSRCTLEDLRGSTAAENAVVLQNALSGGKTKITDTLLLNAGVALFLYGKAVNIAEGVAMAKAKISDRLEMLTAKKRKNYPERKSLKQAIQEKPVIAEIKRASPTAGKIAEIVDPANLSLRYAAGGAAAVSVLTDAAFGGSLSDLAKVAAALENTALPVLCKDFILHPCQIAAAFEAGADAVLLIVASLGENTAKMVEAAHLFGMEALVEVHTIEELKIALEANADVIGVNQRNLRDFTMHPETFEKLSFTHPCKVALSGMRTREDAKYALSLGYHAVLIGETLSSAENPETFIQQVSHVD